MGLLRIDRFELDGIKYVCEVEGDPDGSFRRYVMPVPEAVDCPQRINPTLKSDDCFTEDKDGQCCCLLSSQHTLPYAKALYGIEAFDENPGPSPA